MERRPRSKRSLEALSQENVALTRAITLLHEVGNLARQSLELRPMAHAVLTGVTAGVGLGLNRAMLFRVADDDPETLVGWAAVGPVDAAEADRVWRSIEADSPDLETLYEAGQRQCDHPGSLDGAVRKLRIPMAHNLADAALLRAKAAGKNRVDLGLNPST